MDSCDLQAQSRGDCMFVAKNEIGWCAVLTAYNTYLMEEKVYQFRLESANDAENKMNASEEKFRGGLVSYEEYSGSRATNNEVQISLALAEAAYKNAQVNLEGIVGMELDAYLAPADR